MDNLAGILSGTLLIAGLIYIIFLRPLFEKRRNELIFDNQVIAFIDGLYFSGIEFGCPISDMRIYVKNQLSKAHQLPGNQFLIEYTTSNGYRFCSHTSPNDHMLFAILCIAQFAKEYNNDELKSWAEPKMLIAHKESGLNYTRIW